MKRMVLGDESSNMKGNEMTEFVLCINDGGCHAMLVVVEV